MSIALYVMNESRHAVHQPGQTAPPLIDGHGRTIDHLRLSLIDQCNLACRYCVSDDAATTTHKINPDFAAALVRWLSCRHGIHHVRLTGGEPLLYPGLEGLIGKLGEVTGLDEITLTTNAQALAHRAKRLNDAGLTRINISLDTLNPERFERLTRGGRIEHTLAGIEAAIEAGLEPIRMNAVAQRGVNDDEFCDIAEWGLQRGCVVRFLEAMPIGPLAHDVERHLVPAAEILEKLSTRFELRPIARPAGQPSTDYAASAGPLRGVIGVIASTTRPFCESCRRIRITARGHLMTCLFSREGVDLSQCWNGSSLDEERASKLLCAAVAEKRKEGYRQQTESMIQIGG